VISDGEEADGETGARLKLKLEALFHDVALGSPCPIL